jgi:hypothetical protein
LGKPGGLCRQKTIKNLIPLQYSCPFKRLFTFGKTQMAEKAKKSCYRRLKSATIINGRIKSESLETG